MPSKKLFGIEIQNEHRRVPLLFFPFKESQWMTHKICPFHAVQPSYTKKDTITAKATTGLP
jgi:hypothetical protein